jgi:hypothetical protein
MLKIILNLLLISKILTLTDYNSADNNPNSERFYNIGIKATVELEKTVFLPYIYERPRSEIEFYNNRNNVPFAIYTLRSDNSVIIINLETQEKTKLHQSSLKNTLVRHARVGDDDFIFIINGFNLILYRNEKSYIEKELHGSRYYTKPNYIHFAISGEYIFIGAQKQETEVYKFNSDYSELGLYSIIPRSGSINFITSYKFESISYFAIGSEKDVAIHYAHNKLGIVDDGIINLKADSMAFRNDTYYFTRKNKLIVFSREHHRLVEKEVELPDKEAKYTVNIFNENELIVENKQKLHIVDKEYNITDIQTENRSFFGEHLPNDNRSGTIKFGFFKNHLVELTHVYEGDIIAYLNIYTDKIVTEL